MGNPHAVLQVNSLDTAPVNHLGPLLERHESFPNGVNVGFMQIIDRHHIKLRVFERGVGETLACGSGACAAVVAGRIQGLLDSTVKVELPGGSLQIVWAHVDTTVVMTGPANRVFTGEIEL
jgi:diaminopimelate epimerase